MTILLVLLKQSKKLLFFAVLFSVASANAFTVMIGLIHKGLEGKFTTTMVWGFVAALASYGILDVFAKRLFLKLSLTIVSGLRVDLSRVLLRSPLQSIEALATHRLQAILQSEMDFVAHTITDMANFVIKLFQIIGVVGYFAFTNPQVLIVSAIFIPILFFLQYLPTLRAAEYINRERTASWAMYKRFEEVVFGVRELFQNYAKRNFFLKNELEADVQTFKRASLYNRTLDFMFSHWNDVLIFICLGILIFYFGRNQIISQSFVRDIVLFILVLKDPAMSAINLVASIYRANIRLRDINSMGLDIARLHDLDIDKVNPEAWKTFLDFKKIELRGVTFTYANAAEPFTLGPVDLVVNKGELLYVIGGNGSGKTTLIKLLAGLYEPTGGEIYVDGQQITHELGQTYRDLFHVIFSDFYLFSHVKFENFEALKRSECDQLIKLFELEGKAGINHLGGMHSVNLSQGQRKRLALIVALLEDRPIYILDEWAADQDPHFKKIFYHKILPELKAKGKTLIVISHDDRYYDGGDRQVSLTEGKIR